VLILAAAAAAYIVFGRRTPEQSAAAPAPSPEATRPAQPSSAGAITLPPLNESDAVIRDLVKKLSSHPRVAAWLTTDDLIRNFTVVVSNIADGKAPTVFLRPLRPTGDFRVLERKGDVFIDTRSYDRYTPLADAVESVDANGSAALYATVKPRLEEAYRETGEPQTTFDRALERSIGLLLRTPVSDAPIRVEPHGIGYVFADPKLEALTPAQKQLLRMGPANARRVQAKLREIAVAVGIPPERLPAPQ
jgi:hypothetical protein